MSVWIEYIEEIERITAQLDHYKLYEAGRASRHLKQSLMYLRDLNFIEVKTGKPFEQDTELA